MRRDTIRNIAIIAHVDHGKTTLVDAMLKAALTAKETSVDHGGLIMDSMDLERERGITIRAKNASITWQGVKVNIVDTPGHADFGGEVERTLRMVDGVLLLVDAKEGPMPQTKFVLKKALQLGHKAIVVVNKIDKPDARIDEVVNRTFDLFVELGANDEQLNFPIVYTVGREGTATLELAKKGTDLVPLMDTILSHIPAPEDKSAEPLQMLVLALMNDQFKGKMGIGKITSGTVKKGQSVMQMHVDGKSTRGKVTDVLTYVGLSQREVEGAASGDIVAIAGMPDIAIGETIADAEKPVALPPVQIDAPTVQMTFGVNTSPFAGKEGKFVTSRNIRDRLMKELETNVSLRVADTESAETMLVSGRGELHLAVLIETMRREGFELQVSQPQVIFQMIDGVKQEPYELLTIEVPSEWQGTIIEELGKRKGNLLTMQQNEAGEIHFEYKVATRGLLGLKNLLLTKTKGTTILNHVFLEYGPIETGIGEATHGSLIAFETGKALSYGIEAAQERGSLFIKPGDEVYEGQVIGENARDEDLEVNVCKGKKLTNMRSSGADEQIVLTPPREITLEYALEYIGADELLEVTPKSLRLRKRFLKPHERKRANQSMK